MTEEQETKEQKEGISCRLDEFEPKICSPDPTLILFLGRETENPDQIVEALFSREEQLEVNAGVLDLADDSCQELSEKYKIDRDETQLVLFQNCEKKGAVSLSAENAGEQMDRMKKMVQGLETGSEDSSSTTNLE